MTTYVKRRGNETQRAKPWHIKSTEPGRSAVLCGAYRRQEYERWQRHYVEREDIPEGQILCSVCERIQNKIPPFLKKESK